LGVVVHASPATAEPAIKREAATTAETFILTLGGWKWWFWKVERVAKCESD